MTGLVVREDSPLFAPLAGLAADARCVFFAGLPATGKSLLIHQLAHLAHARGRRIHLLQWDVARPVFEASPAGARYPQVDGVTHGIIRLAVGRWARVAVARWHAAHAGGSDLLIGETPFIGHRLVSLARRQRDEAEVVLSAATTRFVLPVPSRELRAHVEAERERRAQAPLHAREREDAPPQVLRALWAEVASVARALGIKGAAESGYDPDVYRTMYERLLVHRRFITLPVTTRLPTDTMSAYEFAIETADVLPAPEDVAQFMADVEASHPRPDLVRREIEAWHIVA